MDKFKKITRGFLVAILFAILSIAISFFLSHRETQELTEPDREGFPGSYIRLSDGITHYELKGDPDRPVVVLFHGGTIPMFIWDGQVEALEEAGFRVLRYDQFGRGTSDRPKKIYNRQFYRKQLLELLTELSITDPVHLVGLSFGGATAVSFAAEYPDRVASLALLAPVFDYASDRPLFSIAGISGVGEWYTRVLGVPKTIRRGGQLLSEAGAPEIWHQWFESQVNFNGFEYSILSMARGDALHSYYDSHQAISNKRMLLIWGNADDEIPRHHIESIRSLNNNIQYVELAGIGHTPNVQSRERVNQELLKFLLSASKLEPPK